MFHSLGLSKRYRRYRRRKKSSNGSYMIEYYSLISVKMFHGNEWNERKRRLLLVVARRRLQFADGHQVPVAGRQRRRLQRGRRGGRLAPALDRRRRGGGGADGTDARVGAAALVALGRTQRARTRRLLARLVLVLLVPLRPVLVAVLVIEAVRLDVDAFRRDAIRFRIGRLFFCCCCRLRGRGEKKDEEETRL